MRKFKPKSDRQPRENIWAGMEHKVKLRLSEDGPIKSNSPKRVGRPEGMSGRQFKKAGKAARRAAKTKMQEATKPRDAAIVKVEI